jgi:hypothetical protein
VVARLDPTVRVPDVLLDPMKELVMAGDSEAAGELVPDEMLDLFG